MTWTRLHEAAEHLDVHMVQYRSHRNSEEVVCVDDHGSTPLHIACWHNPPLKLLEALIEACPQTVSAQDVNGDTPLHIALSYPNTNAEVVKLLLDACPTSTSIANKEGLMPLHQACRYCPSNENVIGLLLDVYPYAARSHIKMGELASRRKRTPMDAKETDHFVLGSSPRGVTNAFDLRFQALSVQLRDGSYPLHMAIASGAPVGVVEALIVEAPEVLGLKNKFGETPLHVALAHNASVPVVQALLQADSDAVCQVDKKEQNTPLHTAAAHGCSAEVAKLLMRKCPDGIHKENKEGKTPLEVAMDHGKCSADILRLLKISDESE